MYLWIDDDHVEIRDASRLWGKDILETGACIKAALRDDTVKTAVIGPAGEHQVPFALIGCEFNRQAGRAGGGAVMGSKNLKAVAVRGTRLVRVHDPQRFARACEAALAELDQSFEQYTDYLAQPHADYDTMVHGIMDIFIDRFYNQPDTIIALASLAAEFSGIRGPVIVKVQAAYDRFVDAFEAALNRIDPRPSNRAAAICFISALQGLAIQALVRDGQIDVGDLVQGFLRLVTPGRNKPPERI